MEVRGTIKDDQLRPAFIVGFPRTGTTLLYRILYRHSAFYPRVCAERPEYNALVEAHFDRWFFYYAVDLWFSEDKKSLRVWFADDSEAYICFLVDCFRSFHIRAAAARKCCRILEKNPNHIFLCEVMVHAFPNVRILCLRRDPVDTMASFRRRRAIQTGPDGAWLDLGYDLDLFIERWNQKAMKWNEFVACYPNYGQVVDYFYLTTEPHATVARALHFVGEEMEPHILAGSTPVEQPGWLDHYDSHIPMPNNDVWSAHVTEDEATRLRAECIPIRDANRPAGNMSVKR